MDLEVLRGKDSKARAEALGDVLERLEQHKPLDCDIAELSACLAANVPDNNPKVCVTACSCVEKLFESYPEDAASGADSVIKPLVEVLGNSKPQARERASAALLTVMSAAGPGQVFDQACSKGLTHKNWRVREGLLNIYAQQAESFVDNAAVSTELIGPASAALGDAQPDVRRAAADALAWLSMQIGINKVLPKLDDKGLRPAQVQSVRDRYAEISGGVVATPGQQDGGASAASSKPPASGQQAAAPSGGSGPGARPAGPAMAPSSQPPPRPASASSAQQQHGATIQRPSTASSVALQQPNHSGGSTPLSTGSGHGTASANSNSRPGTATSSVSGGNNNVRSLAATGGVSGGSAHASSLSAQQQSFQHEQGCADQSVDNGHDDTIGSTQNAVDGEYQPANGLSEGEILSHPLMESLIHLHSGPWWRPGIVGDVFSSNGDAFNAKPINLLQNAFAAKDPSRELVRIIDEVRGACGTTTGDWKARLAAIDKLRGLIIGGAHQIEGFSHQLIRLREPLNCQVQDLRSSIVRQVCLGIAELSSILGHTQCFEPLADGLIETLSKLTYVTIAIIASSAHACICTILHNTRVGYHKVIPKLIACAKTRSPVLRARSSEYLLICLRGWSPAVLDKYAVDLQNVLISLLADADPTARQCARLLYWSFASLFPGRVDAVLSRCDAGTQRLLSEDEETARFAAFDAIRVPLIPAFCTVPVPVTSGSTPGYGGGAGTSSNPSTPMLSSTPYGPAATVTGSAPPTLVSAGSHFNLTSGVSGIALQNALAASRSGGSIGNSSRPSTAPSAPTSAAAAPSMPSARGGSAGGSWPSAAGARAGSQLMQPAVGGDASRGQAPVLQRQTSAPSMTGAASAPMTGRPSTASTQQQQPQPYRDDGYADDGHDATELQQQYRSDAGVIDGYAQAFTSSAAAQQQQHQQQLQRGLPGLPKQGSFSTAAGFERPTTGFLGSENVVYSALPPGTIAPPQPTTISPAQLLQQQQLQFQQQQAQQQQHRPDLFSAAQHVLDNIQDPSGFRDRFLQFLDACVWNKAVDARSVVRSYVQPERVPRDHLKSLPQSALSEAAITMSGASNSSSFGSFGAGAAASSAAVALHYSYTPFNATPNVSSEGMKQMLTLIADGRLQRIVSSCFGSGHDPVAADGLALLSSILDTNIEIGAVGGSNLGSACMGPGVTPDGSASDGRPLPINTHALFVPSSGYAAPRSVTIVPVYARMVLVQGSNGTEGASDGGSTSSTPGGAGTAVGDSFRSLFRDVMKATVMGGTMAATASKRAIATMRRAYPVSTLLAVTSALLLTESQPRMQVCSLHLIRDLMGEAGAHQYFASAGADGSVSGVGEMRLQRLLARVADMLCAAAAAGAPNIPGFTAGGISATSSSSYLANSIANKALDPGNPSSPFHRLPELVDLLVQSIASGLGWSSNGSSSSLNNLLISALCKLSPDQIRAIVTTCDSKYGGGCEGIEATVHRAKYGATAAPAPLGVAAAPSSTAAPTTARSAAAPPMPPPPTASSASAAVATSSSAASSSSVPGVHIIPLTRANLELVLDTLASSDENKQLRALHYFGRAVDAPSAGAPLLGPTPSAAAGAPVAAGALPLTLHPPASTLQIPPIHRDDPVWMSLLDRVITSVLACVLPTRGPAATPAAGGGGSGGQARTADALVMTQTSLSVIRKLFRNCCPYVASKSGTIISVVCSSIRSAPREVATVLERTCEEICDRLPLDMATTHMVTVLANEMEAAPGSATTPGSNGTAGIGASGSSSVAEAGSVAVTLACLRILTRLVPRMPSSSLLLSELNKGRLMTSISKAFLSTSTDVRRAVVGCLVEMHLALRGTGAFARYAESYLSPPQQKLLQIYIDKAQDRSAVAAPSTSR